MSLLSSCAFAALLSVSHAQEPSAALSPEQTDLIVESLTEKIAEAHFSEDIRTQYLDVLAHLSADALPSDPDALALTLHRALQARVRDGHMGVYGPERTRRIFGQAEFAGHDDHAEPFEPGPGPERLSSDIWIWGLRDFSTESLTEDLVVQHLSGIRPGDALLLDLRGNRGGDAQVLRWIAGCLFATPEPLYAIDWRREDRVETTRQHSTPRSGCQGSAGARLYIIVDGLTASTAELAALLLQEQRDAIVVGAPTYGAAHAAEMFELADGFGAMIPIGRTYLASSGSSWEGTGVPVDWPSGETDALEFTLERVRLLQACHRFAADSGYQCELDIEPVSR